MATNLRLRPDAQAALRAEAERSGRSQQDLLRDAVDLFLGLRTSPRGQDRGASAADTTDLQPPRTPYQRVTPTLDLPSGTSSLDLLDRDDRL